MNYCKNCGLPENYQGIHLDENGVCNFCHFYDKHRERLNDFEALEKEFCAHIEKAKEEAKRQGSKYDCLVASAAGRTAPISCTS